MNECMNEKRKGREETEERIRGTKEQGNHLEKGIKIRQNERGEAWRQTTIKRYKKKGIKKEQMRWKDERHGHEREEEMRKLPVGLFRQQRPERFSGVSARGWMAKCVWMFYSTSRLSLHYRMNLMKNGPRLQVNNYTARTGRHDRQPEGQNNWMDPAGAEWRGGRRLSRILWVIRESTIAAAAHRHREDSGWTCVGKSSFSDDPLIDNCLGWCRRGKWLSNKDDKETKY